MNLWSTLTLLLYAFGIYAFASLLLYWPKTDAAIARTCSYRSRGELSAARLTGVSMLTLCLVWFILQIVLLVATLDPEVRSPFVQWIDLLRVLLVFFFPPAIMQITYLDLRQRDRVLEHPAWRISILATWPLSVGVGVYLLLVFLDVLPRPHSVSAAINIPLGALFGGAAVYAALAMSRGRRSSETSNERSERRWMSALYAGLVLFAALIVAAHLANLRLGDLFQTIGASMPLLFMITSIYHESRFRFFDLFVKSGISFLVAAIGLAAFFGLLFPWIESLQLGTVRPWVLAVVLLPVAAGLLWMHRRLGRWIDAVWLGRRSSPVEALQQFQSDIGRACTSGDLVERAERGLAQIFDAPARIQLDLREAPDWTFDCVQDVPLRIDGRPAGAILMGRRRNQMPYFSGDIALLDSLANLVSIMLDNVDLQERRREQDRVARELTLQASRSELKALRAQINPHFLFNALNVIAGLIHKDPLRADQTVEKLAEIFRYTLRGSESEWARLDDELDFVRAYLDVEQARFGDRLEVRVTTDPQAGSLRIPTMIVQTLVENAVKHGVAAVRGASRIEVDARREKDRLVVEVADSGPGFAESHRDESSRGAGRAKGTGYGLKNVRERLAGYFGDRGRLETRRDDERRMTVVSVLLPIDRAVAPSDGADRAGESPGAA